MSPRYAAPPGGQCVVAPRLNRRSHRQLTATRLSSSTGGDQPSTSGPSPPPLPIPVPKAVSGLLKSLQDFGIGKNSLREGGVGLFLLGGAGAALALLAWARGNAMRVGTPYHLTIELPLACGITIGTPVRIRGVQVGQVLNVKPSLERVDVLCEVRRETMGRDASDGIQGGMHAWAVLPALIGGSSGDHTAFRFTAVWTTCQSLWLQCAPLLTINPTLSSPR